MSIFGFLGLGNVASGMGGAAMGAGITYLIQKYTTGKTLDKLEERLGGAELEIQERIIKRIALLKTLAYRDGEFSDSERVFIYRYILNNPDLAADIKVALALDLDDPPPAQMSVVLERVRSMLSFSELFSSEEEAIGFMWVMYSLANADGSFDTEEASYIKKVCKDCKIPLNLIPKEFLLITGVT